VVSIAEENVIPNLKQVFILNYYVLDLSFLERCCRQTVREVG
jgi:hypothetical protein